VLDAIGNALQLDEAERAHLADLIRTANAERPPRRSPTPQRVRPSVARLVDVMGAIPAWAAHDVGFHRTATKQMHHPLVGDLSLTFEMLELPADPGLSLLTYAAEPGSDLTRR